MKSQFLVPGMIFSLVDRRPVSISGPGTLPMHFYLVISSGSEACLQDVQCMSISSMRNKDITYELPVVVNDTVSYVIPYNIVSFRRDDIQMQYYRGFLVGDSRLISTNDFLQLCRDVYTDTLYGDIDKTIKDRISDYQKKFSTVFKDVPRYLGTSDSKFATSTVIQRQVSESLEEDEEDFNVASSISDNFKATLTRIDGLPHSYTNWSNEDVFSALLFFNDNDLIDIVSQSNRYKSVGTLDNVKRTLRRIVKGMSTPMYKVLVNGREYTINFATSKCTDTVNPSDLTEVQNIQNRIKKAMR